MGDFYGTGIEIYAGFRGQKKNKKHCNIHTKKFHKMMLFFFFFTKLKKLFFL